MISGLSAAAPNEFPLPNFQFLRDAMPDARMMLFPPSLPTAAPGVRRRRHPARSRGRRRRRQQSSLVLPSLCPSSLQFGEHPTTFASPIRIRLRSRPFPECTRKKAKERARALTSSAQAARARASHPLSSSPTAATGRSLSVCLPCLGSRQSRPLRRCRHLATRKNNR